MIKDSDHRQGAVVAIAVLKKNIVGCHHLAGPGDLESSLALGAHCSHVKLLDFAENLLDLITKRQEALRASYGPWSHESRFGFTASRPRIGCETPDFESGRC